MGQGRKCRGRKAAGRTLAAAAASPAAAALPAPPLPEDRAPAQAEASAAADLTEDSLLLILGRLAPADLLRAALACRRWRRVATRASRARAPPLLGYFFHPADPVVQFPIPCVDKTYPATFVPLDAAAPDQPRLALDRAAEFSITDVRFGLVVLLPVGLPKALLPRVLVVDPASRRRTLLPPSPRDRDDPWRRHRQVFGVAVLSREHPSRLSFDAVMFTVDGDRPRAWVASVRDGDCTWRVLPRSENVQVDFDPWWFEGRCVHAAGIVYWHICNSSRLLALDPRTMEFSYVPVPAVLGDRFEKYRIGEAHEDGRLCMAAVVEDQELQIWVRGETRWSDRGWMLEKRIRMRKALDTIPGFPRNLMIRMLCTWLSDLDYAQTGKVFIKTWGYGRYSFDLETGKLERLEMEDGKEHGDPIYAYNLAWPPAFLA